MHLIRFGRRDRAAGRWLVWERLWWRGYKLDAVLQGEPAARAARVRGLCRAGGLVRGEIMLCTTKDVQTIAVSVKKTPPYPDEIVTLL